MSLEARPEAILLMKQKLDWDRQGSSLGGRGRYSSVSATGISLEEPHGMRAPLIRALGAEGRAGTGFCASSLFLLFIINPHYIGF